MASQNYWSPFRDWNKESDLVADENWLGLKTTEALLGIETTPTPKATNKHKQVSKLLKPF